MPSLDDLAKKAPEKNICKIIKNQIDNLKLIAIIINSQTRSGQKSNLYEINMYQQIFGANFWPHVVFVISHWSESPE